MADMTDRSTQRVSAPGNRKAAWTLIVLAPLSAEVTFSGVSMPGMWLLLPVLVVMYGAGVLLLRELVVRSGGSWPSLLVMGLIYELVEDGIGLQALTSPNLYNAAVWGPRVLGFNTTYWESQIGYHTVFSVLIPVLLADLLFPGHRNHPYLRHSGLAVTALAAVIGVVLLRVGIAGIEDPGYQTPPPVVIAILVVVAALLYVALRVLPGRTPTPPAHRPAPRPVLVALIAATACGCFLALLMPAGLPPEGADGPAIGTGAWVLIPMALAAAITGYVGWLVYRWSAATNWSDTYRIWLIGGALIGRTLYAMLTAPAANDYNWTSAAIAFAIGTTMIAAMTYLLMRLARRIRQDTAAEHRTC